MIVHVQSDALLKSTSKPIKFPNALARINVNSQ